MIEILLIIVLCLANGLFSSAELALVSARRGRLQQLADGGNGSAQVALQLQDDPNRLLSTVQVGITLIGTLAGAFGGASIAEQLAVVLQPSLGSYAEPIALVLVVAVIAYLQLVIGELVPKRLALQSAEPIAMLMARPMALLAAVSRPVIALLTASTEALLALLGRRNTDAAAVTEEDIRQLMREGVAEGAIEPAEHAMIESVINLGDRSVRQIMTPRHTVQTIYSDIRLVDVVDSLLASGFSRFPVINRQDDDIVGIAHVRDLFILYRKNPDAPVREAMRPALFVPESSRAAALMNQLRTQQHMAVVIGELGTIEGVVTLEDVLEEIVGEIDDEYDEATEELFVQRDDGSLLVSGMAPIERVGRTLALQEALAAEPYRVETMAGLMLSLFGRIPQVGDKLEWQGWVFEIMDMDALRIDKVLAQKKML